VKEGTMRVQGVGRVIAVGLVLAGLAGSAWSQAPKPRIKVTVENATIRIKPDAAGDVIASPSVGSVFDVESKAGEWYEIKYRTSLGILVSGYIHEMFVEIEKAPVEKPAVPAARQAERIERPAGIRFAIKATGLAAFRPGYDYSYSTTVYAETMTIGDTVAQSTALGFSLELGVFLLKSLEVTAGVDVVSKATSGTVSLSVPNMYLYNDIASDSASTPPSQKALAVACGFNYHLVPGGKLDPYLGAGASYIMATMDLLEDISYNDTFTSDSKHTVEITGTPFANTSVKTFGFFGRAGVGFDFTPNVAAFVEGRYTVAKKDVPHPLTSTFDTGEVLHLDFGGASARAGIRVVF
jgi:opacity protein-like surface antigen